MRKLLSAALVLAVVLPASAQQPVPAASARGWSRVESLAPGTSIHISATSHSVGCKVKMVDDASLTCVSGDGAKTEVFPKSEIKKITIAHRGRSTLVGLGIGAGFGAILGAATGGVDNNNTASSFQLNILSRSAVALLGAVVFGAIGAIVGALTDFTHSTIYKA